VAQRDSIKELKDFVEGGTGGINGNGDLVKACVDSYIFEYFFYAGAAKPGTPDHGIIIPRLNAWLELEKPEWAFTEAVSGSAATDDEPAVPATEATLRKIDPVRYKDVLADLWSNQSSAVPYAKNLHDAVTRIWSATADASRSARLLAEEYENVLFQTENQYAHEQKGTKHQISTVPKPNFLFWPGKDLLTTLEAGSSPGGAATTALQQRDILTFLQLYRASGMMSLGAGGSGTNRIPARATGANNPLPFVGIKQYNIRIQSPGTRAIKFMPIMAPVNALTQYSKWVIDTNAADHIDYYKKTFPAYTGPEMKAMYDVWDDGSFSAGRGEYTLPGYTEPYIADIMSLTKDFPGLDRAGRIGAGSWDPGTVWIGFPDSSDTEINTSVNWVKPTNTFPQRIAYFNMRVVAAIASVYPGYLLERIKDVLGKTLEAVLAVENNYETLAGKKGAADSVFIKEKINPNAAALKPYNDQCFLVENIFPLTQWRESARHRQYSVYKNLGIIGAQHKAPGNLISYLNHGGKTDEVNALLNLCPDVYALLTPYIKIYRVDYEKDKTLVPYQETEIPFPVFIQPGDIQAITDKDYGRFPGAGIKSFSWNLDGVNPAEVENNISANLVLHFQTVQDFFSLNTSLTAGASEAGYLDLVIGSGTSFQDKPVASVEAKKEEKSISSACVEAATSKYEGERFRIKIVAGWNTPANFQNIVDEMDGSRGKSVDYGKNLEDAINQTRVALYLQNTTHELTFNEDGSVGLNIDYQASLSGILRAPNADIFTGGTEYDQKIEKLEESLNKKDKEIKDLSAKMVSEASKDDPALKVLTDEKVKLLEDLTSLIKKEKSLKYKRFLCNLYTSGKIYSLKVPRKDFKLLKDLSPAQRAREAHRRMQGDLYKAGFEPQNPTNADLDGMNDMASYLIDQGAAKTDTAEFAQELKKLGFAKSLKTMSTSDIEIPYFYLGDFIDGILGYLENIVTREGTSSGSFQLLLGQIELIDPHLAFQIREVDVRCGNAKDAIITRAMADINPLKFRGLNNIKFSTSISNLPISLEYFQEWFVNNVVRSQREKYPFLGFIKAVCSSLIAHSFNSACFNDALQFHLRFDTSIFNLDKSYTGKVISTKALAKSKNRADMISRKLFVDDTHVVPSMILYSVDSQPTSKGDYTSDLKNGIYHYYLGASCGIAKKIQFQRQNMPYYREARIGRTSALSAVQLRELYNAQIEMVGNNLHRNGQYLFINPIAIGAGAARPQSGVLPSFAQLLGIGGYYLISKVSHEISAGGFDVSVTAIQEGQSFAAEDNTVVSTTGFADSSVGSIKAGGVTSPEYALGTANPDTINLDSKKPVAAAKVVPAAKKKRTPTGRGQAPLLGPALPTAAELADMAADERAAAEAERSSFEIAGTSQEEEEPPEDQLEVDWQL